MRDASVLSVAVPVESKGTIAIAIVFLIIFLAIFVVTFVSIGRNIRNGLYRRSEKRSLKTWGVTSIGVLLAVYLVVRSFVNGAPTTIAFPAIIATVCVAIGRNIGSGANKGAEKRSIESWGVPSKIYELDDRQKSPDHNQNLAEDALNRDQSDFAEERRKLHEEELAYLRAKVKDLESKSKPSKE